MSKGLVLVGAIALALVLANGANADEGGARPVSGVVPVREHVEPPGITAYADDPAAGAQLCRTLERLHPGMDCRVFPASASPNGTPWYQGRHGTSWSVG